MPETVQPHVTLAVCRALFIAEVFGNICDFASDSVLAALARSCKAFQEPALRTLWSHLPSLTPLIRCLPEYAITVDDKSNFQFSRTLRSEDWDSLIRYASYVQNLGSTLPGAPSRSTSWTLQAIRALRPRLVLFPNLRQVLYGSLGLDDDCFPHFLSLVGTELRVCESERKSSDTDGPSGAVHSALSLLSTQTHLESLKLVGPRPLASSPALSSFLCSMSTMHTLNVDGIPITQDALVHIASLPSLRIVHIRLPDSTTWNIPQPMSPAFMNVTSLAVSATVGAYQSFAQILPLHHIPEFTFALIGQPSSEPISTLFTSICHQFGAETLKALSVGPEDSNTAFKQMQDAIIYRVVAKSSDFHPLYEFTALERLSVMSPWGFALDNDMAHDMANAWPRMQDLRLACAQWCYPGPERLRLQMDGLAYFAAYCPELHTLAIPFDAESWEHSPDTPRMAGGKGEVPEHFYAALEGRRSVSRLERLWVNILPIAGPAQVALYLSRLFPQLKTTWDEQELRTDPPSDDYVEYQGQWEEMERILHVIIMARDDGRRMAQESTATGAGAGEFFSR